MDVVAVETLNNPRKHRRFDKEPPDRGGPGNRPSQPDVVVDADGIMVTPSYKDSLLHGSGTVPGGEEFDADDDIDILEGEVIRSTIDGLISIEFSDRIKKLAAKSLDQTLVIKLLGASHRLMDIDNDYFLVTFKDHSDFFHVLANGPWTVFGHYLTVEPWTSDFSSSNPFPSTVWIWIRLPDSCSDIVHHQQPTPVNDLPQHPTDQSVGIDTASVTAGASKTAVDNTPYGPWMVVEPRPRPAPRKQLENNARH
ncbi:hypothetical protein V6N12_074630 [Hibiscus sabdariffa]|uniref:DUF4283 domain-containing protein n=1 Tax=Hibiscus sabdariffa TaxID=183260 RepID=A0ABR2BXU0_9ROSI